MPGRVRSRDLAFSTPGTAKRNTGSNFAAPTTAQVTRYEYCSDTTEAPPYNPHALTKYEVVVAPPYVNGTCAYSFGIGGTVTFQSYAPNVRTLYANCPLESTVSAAYFKTLALANLNPRNPVVDVPLFLFELREFPKMLRDLGRVLSGRARPSDVPGGFLAHQFGWAPLVSDLSKMLDLQRQMDGRMRYLAGITKGIRVRRRLATNRLLGESLISDGYQQFNVGGTPTWAVQADIKVSEYLDVWMTCYVKSAVHYGSLKDGSLGSRARRLALGLSARPDMVWNALPWTWLIDYFANVGDMIEAADGLRTLDVKDMCIMIQQRVTSSLQRIRLKPGLTMASSKMSRIVKRRSYYPDPHPSFSRVPFFNGRQAAILGSLATSRALRSVRL